MGWNIDPLEGAIDIRTMHLKDLGVSTGQYLSATIDQGLADMSPAWFAQQGLYSETGTQARGLDRPLLPPHLRPGAPPRRFDDAGMTGIASPTRDGRVVMDWEPSRLPADQRERLVPIAEANERAKGLGQTFTEPVSQSYLDAQLRYLTRRHQNEEIFQRARNNGEMTALRYVLGGLTDMATQLADPFAMAANFIPFVGEARYAMWAMRFNKAAASVTKGGIEGALGNAALEAMVAPIRAQHDPDYHFTDSLLNIAFGGVLGGGLHLFGTGLMAAGKAAGLVSEPTRFGYEPPPRARPSEPPPPEPPPGAPPVAKPPEPPPGPPPAVRPPEPPQARIADTLQQGDNVKLHTGDSFTVVNTIEAPALKDRIVQIRWDDGTEATLKGSTIESHLNAGSYIDAATGERRTSAPAEITRAPTHIGESIERVSHETKEAALRSALAQAETERPINVDAIVRADPKFVPPVIEAPTPPPTPQQRRPWWEDRDATALSWEHHDQLMAQSLERETRPLKVPDDFVPTPEVKAMAARLRKGLPAIPEGKRPVSLSEHVIAAGGISRQGWGSDMLIAEDFGRKLVRQSKSRGGTGLEAHEMAQEMNASGFSRYMVLEGADNYHFDAATFLKDLIDDARGIRKIYPDGSEDHLGAKAFNAGEREWFGKYLREHPAALETRELQYLLSLDPMRREYQALAHKADMMARKGWDEQSVEAQHAAAAHLDTQIVEAYEKHEKVVQDRLAAKREGFDPELEADPELAQRMRTERAATLEDLDRLDREMLEADNAKRQGADGERGEAGRDGGATGRDRPGDGQPAKADGRPDATEGKAAPDGAGLRPEEGQRAEGAKGTGADVELRQLTELPSGLEFRTRDEYGLRYITIVDKGAGRDAPVHYELSYRTNDEGGLAGVSEVANETRKHSGLGLALYAKAIEDARSQGRRLAGSGSEYAQRVWSELERRGLARRVKRADEDGNIFEIFEATDRSAETPREAAPVVEFTTAKGSTYKVEDGGKTTRDKAARPEHPGEVGPQPTSHTTIYVDQKGLDALGEFQTQGGPDMALRPTGDGRWGIQYKTGKDAAKFERRTVVEVKDQPAVGLFPVEIWDGPKQRVHFGNAITEVRTAPEARPAARVEPASERTAQGEQLLMPGVEPVKDADRLALMQSAPMRGGDSAVPEGGLFDTSARRQTDVEEWAKQQADPKLDTHADPAASVKAERDAASADIDPHAELKMLMEQDGTRLSDIERAELAEAGRQFDETAAAVEALAQCRAGS